MSILDQIQTLEELAAVDSELRVLEEQLMQERATLNGLKENHERLKEKLTTDRASVAALDKTRNDFVIEVRTMMQQLEHSREKLNRSRNEREANAAQRELEELRKLVRDREEEVNKLNLESETSHRQIEATEQEAQKIADELGSQEGDINSRLGTAETEKAKHQTEREKILKKLPPALYRKYDMIRSKRGTGIAQTSDGICKACNMALPPQLFHRLRREPMLEQCPSCNRIIYFVAPVAQVAASSGADATGPAKSG